MPPCHPLSPPSLLAAARCRTPACSRRAGPPTSRREIFRAEMLFASDMPTHAQKNRARRALAAFKLQTSQQLALWLLSAARSPDEGGRGGGGRKAHRPAPGLKGLYFEHAPPNPAGTPPAPVHPRLCAGRVRGQASLRTSQGAPDPPGRYNN